MAKLSNDLVKAGKFDQYKQVFGVDLPLAQCALNNITPEQKEEFESSCDKNCKVESSKRKLLSYSNSIFINLVSIFLFNSGFSFDRSPSRLRKYPKKMNRGRTNSGHILFVLLKLLTI